jgi:hypothetical protein
VKELPQCCPACRGKAIFVTSAGFVCLNRDCNYRECKPDALGASAGIPKVNKFQAPESAGPSHVVTQGSPFGGSV